jgi:hypothetical protein
MLMHNMQHEGWLGGAKAEAPPVYVQFREDKIGISGCGCLLEVCVSCSFARRHPFATPFALYLSQAAHTRRHLIIRLNLFDCLWGFVISVRLEFVICSAVVSQGDV